MVLLIEVTFLFPLYTFITTAICTCGHTICVELEYSTSHSVLLLLSVSSSVSTFSLDFVVDNAYRAGRKPTGSSTK